MVAENSTSLVTDRDSWTVAVVDIVCHEYQAAAPATKQRQSKMAMVVLRYFFILFHLLLELFEGFSDDFV